MLDSKTFLSRQQRSILSILFFCNPPFPFVLHVGIRWLLMTLEAVYLSHQHIKASKHHLHST